ncbi:MAG TPA: DUF2461 domain-containing protein [Thermoanaerobaculia bacterium]|nr:DUF2461 domain-containing protein [Thermoanaerobaculia bacterium]
MTTNGFHGIPPEGLDFLRGLEEHNTKEWFHEHKAMYEMSLRRPVLALLAALDGELADFAPAYRVADPRKAVSRPNRDTRFSADKSPYRTDVSAVLPRAGRAKQEVAGFFFSVAADGVDLLGGAYMPGPPQLAALRRHLVARAEPFRRLVAEIEATGLVGTLQGERLKRVPRDFSADDPDADLARYKQLYFRTRLDPEVATSERLVPELSRRFRLLTPFVELLDEGLAAVSS